MSVSIPQSFVDQFSANVHMLAEQRMSRLRNTVLTEDVQAESVARERVGKTQDTANEINERHGDTPLNNTPHTRRWAFMKDFDVADLIDRNDKVKALIDPQSIYTVRHAGVMGRTVDDEIINAALGTAKEGKNGDTDVALPASQKIADGSTNLTVAKLIEAKEKFDAAEVDEFIPRFMIVNSAGISSLLGDTSVTSADFNTVKALVRGEINEFMGFTFIRSERLPVASNIRSGIAMAQQGILLGFASQPQSTANERPDKRNAQQIYTWGSWGSVRVEDEMVVQVDYDETA